MGTLRSTTRSLDEARHSSGIIRNATMMNSWPFNRYAIQSKNELETTKSENFRKSAL